MSVREAWQRAVQPLDDTWARGSSSWKTKYSKKQGEEVKENRAHLWAESMGAGR